MFDTLLVQPIYNAFIFLTGLMPMGDVGLAIIAMTVLIRVVLYPIFTAQIRTQIGMQALAPELESLKIKHKNDREKLAREQLALFKRYNVNPLSGIGVMVVQLVVIFALYFALFHKPLPEVDVSFLYSFVSPPADVSTNFFGILDLLTPHHVVLAALVALSQYATIVLTLRRTPPGKHLSAEQQQITKMQQGLMRYFLPGLVGVVTYFFPGAVGLYFLVGNVFSLGQEWLIKHKFS